jgi:hypothetical protein
MQVASHLSGRPSKPPSSVRYRMADELEPPTLAEMRVAIDSVLPPRRVVPWGWILGLAGVIVAGLVVWVIGSRSSVGPAVVVPVATVAAPQGATVELGSASASASAPARTPASAPASASASASASEPALAPEPAPVRRAGKSSPPPSRIDDVGDPFAGKR